MESRHEQAKKMRREGKTYAEIGEALNVSRQRAEQIVRSVPGDGIHVSALRKIPYKGLREWMLANRVSIKKLEELCESDVRRAVRTGGGTKRLIDAILRVTGLDYETCFEVD